MYSTIEKMKCYNKNKELQNAKQVFQKGIFLGRNLFTKELFSRFPISLSLGILMSINSVKALRAEMKKKFNFNYLLTHRLNQDCLENMFSQMRYRNGANDHPTPTECLNNLKHISNAR